MGGKDLRKILDAWPLNHRIHRGLINLIKLLQLQIDEHNERTSAKKPPIKSRRR